MGLRSWRLLITTCKWKIGFLQRSHWEYELYFRAGLMPVYRRLKHNELNIVFGSSLSRDVSSGLCFAFTLKVLCIYVMVLVSCFYGISLYADTYIPASICVSMGFLYMQTHISLHLYVFLRLHL